MEPPKRVLVTLDALDSSGAVFSAQNLLYGLARQGVSLMVLARTGGVRDRAFDEIKATTRIDKYFGLPLLGRSTLAAVQAFSPQIIHAQTPQVLGRSMRIASALNVGVVVTANRLDDRDAVVLDKYADAGIVAVSDAIQERFSNRGGISRARIRVIPNGLDLSRLTYRSAQPSRASKTLPVVGTYGSLLERKGQRVLLEAAATVLSRGVDVEFLILGQGPDKPELRRLAEELHIANRVTFTHSTSSDLDTMKNIDIFVEPSFQEGLGLSVLQAMACGIPVIASGVGGIYSLVEDGVSGILVPPGQAEVLADRIIELLAAPARQTELVRNARERVETEFSADAVSRRMVQYYADHMDAHEAAQKGRA